VTRVEARLKALGAPNGTFVANFLVDTGATDCLAPAGALREIGVEPVGSRTYELADGTRHEYPFGLVQIEIMGEVTAGRVIFGPDGVEPLVGVATLESAGLTIDPTTQQLKKLPAVPLKYRNEP
jgi:clan AA aspartic protease